MPRLKRASLWRSRSVISGFVTCSLVLPVFPAGSVMLEPVTLTVRVCLPVLVCFVFQLVDALVPLTVCVLNTVLSSINVKVFDPPSVPVTLALIDTVPLTVEPAAGFVIFTAGCTVIVSVGGLGSLSPTLSAVVSDAVEVPAVGNVTVPALSTELVVGFPFGKYHEYPDTEPSVS